MDKCRKGIYTVSVFSKEYVKNNDTKLKEVKISGFIKGVYDEILDAMILENYNTVLAGLIKFEFRRVERNFNKLAVDFGASNKKKAEILARGGKLATRIDTSPNGNPIFDDGELWMVFHTDPFYVTMTIKNILIYRNKKALKLRSINVWERHRNTKAIKRFMNYEKKGLVNKLNVPLDNGSKNNII